MSEERQEKQRRKDKEMESEANPGLHRFFAITVESESNKNPNQ